MIAIFEQELTHYRIPVFSKLQERIKEDIVVFHGNSCKGSGYKTVRQKELLPFKHKLIRNIWIGKNILYWQNITKEILTLKSYRVIIIRGSIRNLSLFLLIYLCRIKKIPVIVWGQGFSRKRYFNPKRNIIDKIYLSVLHRCDAYISYSQDIYDILKEYSDIKKLFVANNTLDTSSLKLYRQKLLKEGKKNIKLRLNLARKYYLSFSGRLQARKKVSYLIDVYSILKTRYQFDIGLIIIGDGEEKDKLYKKVRDRNLYDVHFLGELYGEQAAEYLFASDVMVVPGWLGLVVVHSFALGLPIVSQLNSKSLIGHAPEAIHLKHGDTGIFSEKDNQEKMAEDVIEILNNYDFYTNNVISYFKQNLDIDIMIDGFVQAIDYASSSR